MSYTKEEIDKKLNNEEIRFKSIVDNKAEELNKNINDIEAKNEQNRKTHDDLHSEHLVEHDKTVCEITDLGPKEQKNIFDDMENLSWFDGETNDEISKFFEKYGM